MLEKYAYHRPHFILLGKNESGALRKAALKPGDVETTRDYAERLSFKLDNEIMSLNFGNSVSLSMEGVSVRHFSKEKTSLFLSDKFTEFDEKTDTSMEFHSHLSDSSIQNAGTTHQHMIVLFDILKKESFISEGSPLYCNTDGASKQYRCANALCYLSLLSTKYNINIDRAIGAPGHGKDLVDGLNAVDKHYLKKIMRITKKPDETNLDIKKINVHTVFNKDKVSIAKESARLLRLDRTYGSFGASKHKKREVNRTVRERFYHVRDEDMNNFEYVNMSSKGFPKIIGENYNGMLSCYHLHFDPQLSVNKAALRRIPCACDTFVANLALPWKEQIEAHLQPRFKHNDKCKYIKIFGAYNDWLIIDVSNKKMMKKMMIWKN